LLLLIVTSAQAADPIARTRELIGGFLAVKSIPAGTSLSAADQAANCKAFAALDPFFDFDAMTSEALRPVRGKFSEAQFRQYRTDFRELIRLVAYPNSGDFFRRAEFQLKAGAPGAVVMDAHLKKEDLDTEVTFYWRDSGGSLRLVDASFDGDSLVKDYQNQFSRIVEKEGADGFVRKVREKLEKTRAERPLRCPG
jgi:ABC-type transporter MlaC component